MAHRAILMSRLGGVGGGVPAPLVFGHIARDAPAIDPSTWEVFGPIAEVTEIKPSTMEIIGHLTRPAPTIGDATREIFGHGFAVDLGVFLVGEQNILGSRSNNAPPFICYVKFTAAASGTATYIKVYTAAGGNNVKAAIYSDNAGAPGNKLGETLIIASQADVWIILWLLSGVAIVDGTVYWLAWQNNADVANQYAYAAGGANQRSWEATVWPNFPAAATPAGYANQDWSLWAGY